MFSISLYMYIIICILFPIDYFNKKLLLLNSLRIVIFYGEYCKFGQLICLQNTKLYTSNTSA